MLWIINFKANPQNLSLTTLCIPCIDGVTGLILLSNLEITVYSVKMLCMEKTRVIKLISMKIHSLKNDIKQNHVRPEITP